jgi:Protein of unknown function (DUF1631)
MKRFLIRRIGLSDQQAASRPTLHECIEAVLAQSDGLMDDVITGLETLVSQTRPKVAQINQRVTSKTAVAQLRQQSQDAKALFSKVLRDAVYQTGAQETVRQDMMRFDDFQLLDEAQIDANIEYAMAQQEIVLAVDDVLQPLDALISSLMGWASVRAQLNPLRPEMFARALRETLMRHVASEEERSGMVTPAAGFLGVSLRQLYAELTEWLRSQGIEPAMTSGSAAGGVAAARGKSPESTVSRTLLTLDKLRRLLSGELDAAVPDADQDFQNTVPFSMVALEDLRMVEPMMKRLHARAEQEAERGQNPSRKSASSSTADANPSKKLGKQLGKEVVRLMLDNLVQDHRLLPQVREQVKALEPVLITLSQSDPRFFSERKHPARQLLDKLTQRSLGYVSESDPGFPLFIHSVAQAIEALVGQEGKVASFTEVLSALQAQWERADLTQRVKQEEAAKALLHAEQRNLLAQRLAADFQARVEGTRVTERVSAFLCGPWAQVVAESQLSGANGQSDADGYLALVDDLIWSVQRRLARRNRTRLVQMVPDMLAKLREGLQRIQYPPERTAVFFDELIRLHERAFDPPRAKTAVAPSEPLKVMDLGPDSVESGQKSQFEMDDLQALEVFWLGQDEATDAGYLAEDSVLLSDEAHELMSAGHASAHIWNAHNLVIGSWVELHLKEKWIRVQLTWASPHRSLFMFVSGKGTAHSMSRRTMERLRSRDLMRVVSDVPVVDKALDDVAQTALRNDRDQSLSR